MKDCLLQCSIIGRRCPVASDKQAIVARFKLVDHQAYDLSEPALHPVAPDSIADMATDGESETTFGQLVIGLIVNEQDDQWVRPASPVSSDAADVGRAP